MANQKITLALMSVAICAMFAAPTHVFAADEEAAKALARQNNCFKCHSIDKEKDGPAWRKVSEKYKGKAGAEDRLMTHLTTGEKAKFPDGHEEDHKIIKGEPAQIKNLIQYILSLAQ